MNYLDEHLKRIAKALYDKDLDDCEYVSKAYELLRDIRKEISGAPSIVLVDMKSYKVIPTELADKVEEKQ